MFESKESVQGTSIDKEVWDVFTTKVSGALSIKFDMNSTLKSKLVNSYG